MLPLRLGIGVVYGLALRFGQGQGERGGKVGVWSGVLSFVSPSKVGTSAMRKKKTFIYLSFNNVSGIYTLFYIHSNRCILTL